MGHLSSEERVRYERHIAMPEVGLKGQQRLGEASVFLAGLGGLGSLSAFCLVAAGIGHLRVIDRDRVELGNLNRQILHWTDDIGRLKTDSAREKLERLNPGCRLEAVAAELNRDTAAELTKGCHVILDGTDNLETRKVLNRVSLENRTPFVFGGVDGFNGMVSTFVPGQTPCLECLFPESAFHERRPGVLSPLPALVASIQCMEVIKLVLGMEGILKSGLLYIKGSDMTFRHIAVDRNPDCSVCGSREKG